jgi:plasmid stability protein
MGQIVIRNLDDAVLAALRKHAATAGISTEEQARRSLASAVGLDRQTALNRLDEIRAAIGRVEGGSIVEDLRRDRRRDQK